MVGVRSRFAPNDNAQSNYIIQFQLADLMKNINDFAI